MNDDLLSRMRFEAARIAAAIGPGGGGAIDAHVDADGTVYYAAHGWTAGESFRQCVVMQPSPETAAVQMLAVIDASAKGRLVALQAQAAALGYRLVPDSPSAADAALAVAGAEFLDGMAAPVGRPEIPF